MTGYGRYRYNPWTDSFVEETGIDRLTQPSDFITVRVSDLEKYRTELKTCKRALELMASWMVGGSNDTDLCQFCIGERQELCNGYNRLHNTKEECIKTIVNYYLVEAQDD